MAIMKPEPQTHPPSSAQRARIAELARQTQDEWARLDCLPKPHTRFAGSSKLRFETASGPCILVGSDVAHPSRGIVDHVTRAYRAYRARGGTLPSLEWHHRYAPVHTPCNLCHH